VNKKVADCMAKDEIAILMAAGLGTRMRPLTEQIAKPLVSVLNRPLIETVIDALQKRGVKELCCSRIFKGAVWLSDGKVCEHTIN
jgi:NDP-sugar pyrophosphorylase family protein